MIGLTGAILYARSMCLSMRWNLATSVRWRRSGSDRPAGVSYFADAQALHLRLSQPSPAVVRPLYSPYRIEQYYACTVLPRFEGSASIERSLLLRQRRGQERRGGFGFGRLQSGRHRFRSQPRDRSADRTASAAVPYRDGRQRDQSQ
jgi:hypothetical protein